MSSLFCLYIQLFPYAYDYRVINSTPNPVVICELRMRLPRKNWFAIIRRKFRRSPPSHESVIILRNNASGGSFSESSSAAATYSQLLSTENMAAITIQAHFRSHLARRAFRGLRSLVKLQAVVRGVCVRRQARIALHCMHTLARLQVTVRARQLLSRCEGNQYDTV